MRINALFDLPDVDDTEPLVATAKFTEADLVRFITSGKIKTLGGITSTTQYTADKNALLKICSFNLYPTKNSGYMNKNRFMMLYKMAHKIPFNFGKLVFDHVLLLVLSLLSQISSYRIRF